MSDENLIYTKDMFNHDDWKKFYDKQPMKSEDLLMVGIDIDPKGRDKPMIVVSRKDANNKIEVVNEIDKNVEKIYKILLGIEEI